MRTILNISALGTLSMILFSCYSSRPVLDDDVYVVKSAALPANESLTDETSYSTYRHRKDNGTDRETTYSSDYVWMDYYDPYMSGFYYYDFYPSYWNYRSSYFGPNIYIINLNPNYCAGSYPIYGWGYGGSHYGYYGNYSGGYLNPNFTSYCYFGSSYMYEVYGFSGIYGYGYGYNPYYSYYQSNPYYASSGTYSNYHSGPRGSSGGSIVDPSRRGNTGGQILKMSAPQPSKERIVSELKSSSRVYENINSESRSNINRDQISNVRNQPNYNRPVQPVEHRPLIRENEYNNTRPENIYNQPVRTNPRSNPDFQPTRQTDPGRYTHPVDKPSRGTTQGGRRN